MSFVTQFNTKADSLMERLRTMADGKTPITLFTEINQATLDAIALIAFGINMDSVNDRSLPFSRSISKVLYNFGQWLVDPLYIVIIIGVLYKIRKDMN